MNSFSRALRFIWTQQRGGAREIRRTAKTLTSARLHINADIYTPAAENNRTIVFLHGMSPLGIADPRQVAAAKALSSAGFRVICPELPEIRNLRVEASSITRFRDTLKQILADEELCPGGRVALFAPSFSGAICLKVAADGEVRDRISAVAALGAFSRIERSLTYLMHADDADPYARLIIFANFLPRLKEGKNLARYYFAAAHDNWNATASQNPSLRGFEPTNTKAVELRRLKPNERRFIDRLENDRPFRIEFGDRLLSVMQDTMAAYNVSEVASEVAAPVFLLHGAGDDVIPARESVELSPLLPHSRLVVTPLMGHSHAAVSARMVRDVWRLVSGFSWFFGHAAR